jgi:hypothetical protein
MKPCLKLAYGQNKAKPLSNGGKHTFLLAINEGRRDVPDAQVIIEEAMIKRVGSDSWERTDILARPNMSWGFKPDDHPQKYSTVQLPPGPSLIDFLIGPSRRGDGLGFAIRIDPLQRGIDPFFKDAGRYKFAMQLSSLHTEPEKLILFADWDGKNLVLRPDESSEVLEISGLSA